jgi:hypothetical protein
MAHSNDHGGGGGGTDLMEDDLMGGDEDFCISDSGGSPEDQAFDEAVGAIQQVKHLVDERTVGLRRLSAGTCKALGRRAHGRPSPPSSRYM